MNDLPPIFTKIVFSWRRKKNIIKNIKKQIKYLFYIGDRIINHLEECCHCSIFPKTIFYENLALIHNINEKLHTLNHTPFDIRSVSFGGSYIFAIKLSKIRHEYVKFIQKMGCCRVSEIIHLLTNQVPEDLVYDDYPMAQDLIELLDDHFVVTQCDLYESTQLNKIQGIHDQTVKYPIFVKHNMFTKSFILRTQGCKIFIPVDHQLLSFHGFFRNEKSPSHLKYTFLHKKVQETHLELEKSNVDSAFLKGYLHTLPLKNLLLFNTKDLAEQCQQNFIEFKRLRNKSITDLLKEFLHTEIENQRDIIQVLLTASDSIETQFISLILYDMLEKDSPSVSKQLYKSLHWNHQQILFKTNHKSTHIKEEILEITEDSIPYEKRILLMKTDANIKSKAYDKLKEINNNKGGENTTKAQQYLDALLKIPFGIYKEEPIIYFLKNFRTRVSFFKQKTRAFLDYQHKDTDHWSSQEITQYFKCFQRYILDPTFLHDHLANICNCKQLQGILKTMSLSSNAKKEGLIQSIIEHRSQLDLSVIQDMWNLKYNKTHNPDAFSRFLIQHHQGKDPKFASKIIPKTLTHILENHKIWSEYLDERVTSINRVGQQLDNAVYGMKDAKKEIKRIIAQWINGSNEGYILGFEGPPGTGKTTLAKKGIASCLKGEDNKNRPFSFIALGGSTNGSTLEGHNYTYVGSTYGKIVECLIESKCMNPIIYIDELDKISKTEHGREIIGILIHLTDPSQNKEFSDKYFAGVKLDLSKCLIVFSYNDVSLIDRVLLDRIHRIKIDSLSRSDKIKVAKFHLIPEITKQVGFNTMDIVFSDEVLYHIIDEYTFEAGARRLKECIYDIVREVNLRALYENLELPFIVTKDVVEEVFDTKRKITIKQVPKVSRVGLVNGLYATSAGIGGITTIECFKYLSDSRLSLELTGQQGDIMQESMKVAKTIAWNLLPESRKDYIRNSTSFGLHIHCPEAAQPKDGPSAGVAITISILSLLSNIPVNHTVAVTGEIDLNGNVLEIGGLESKLEGAQLAGVQKVLCPVSNKQDVDRILKTNVDLQKAKLDIILIENIYEAIEHLLGKEHGVRNLFERNTISNLSHNDYLLMFKASCDEAKQLVCVLDAHTDLGILYASSSFKDLFGKNNLVNTSFLELIEDKTRNQAKQAFMQCIEGSHEACIRLKILGKQDTSSTVYCSVKKQDNNLICNIKIIS